MREANESFQLVPRQDLDPVCLFVHVLLTVFEQFGQICRPAPVKGHNRRETLCTPLPQLPSQEHKLSDSVRGGGGSEILIIKLSLIDIVAMATP